MPVGIDQQNPDSAVHPLVHARTFPYTGAEQAFTVPTNVHAITIVAEGASGDDDGTSGGEGLGGEVIAQIPVTPGKKLAIFVGGGGFSGTGGYNGGGNAAQSSCSGDYCAGGAAARQTFGTAEML